MMANDTDVTHIALSRQESRYLRRLQGISPKWRKRLQLRPGESLVSVDALVKILDDRSGELWKTQEAAVWFISRMDLTAEERRQAIDALMRLMASPGYDCSRRATDFAIFILIACACSCVLYTTLVNASAPWGEVLEFGLLVGGVLGLGPASLARIETKEINISHFQRVRNAAAETLGKLQACEGIALMLHALFRGVVEVDNVIPSRWNIQLRRIAAEALPGMLKTLTSAHYGRIPESIVPHLCRALSHSEETLVLSALGALEKVGDGRAVAPVERCMEKDDRPKVRAAAQHIHPLLLERWRNEQAPSVLLRPSSAIAAPTDQLLRAVSGSSPISPNELLRSGDTPAEP